MAGLEIGMLVIGALCFIGSFFFTSKLSGSDLQELEKMTEKEIGILVEKKFREMEESFQTQLSTDVEQAMGDLDVKTDKETNEKILEIGEYADTVLESMNKSHDEVMFMYNMLNEKQEKVTELTATLQKMESEIRYMEEALTEKRVQFSTEDIQVPEVEEVPILQEQMLSMKEELEKKIEEERVEHPLNPARNPATVQSENNQRIIDMYKQGYTEVEIAKKLGIGLGEVKLILGLFN